MNMLKCISWCQQAFHTIWDNMWVGLRIGITIPLSLDPVYLCYFHSLSVPNLLAKPKVLYAVSNQNVILLSNVNQKLEISKSFLIEHHQCWNTFAQDNILKLENILILHIWLSAGALLSSIKVLVTSGSSLI